MKIDKKVNVEDFMQKYAAKMTKDKKKVMFP